MFNEHALQRVWNSRSISLVGLYSQQGEHVDIIHTGTWNRMAGPDFLNAHVRIGGCELYGDVEFHLESADWYKHGHNNDEAYNRVILHLSLDDAAIPIRRADGTSITHLNISSRLPVWLITEHKHSAKVPPCARAGAHVHQHMSKQLDIAANLYFEELTTRIIKDFDPGRPHFESWVGAIFKRICGILGKPSNESAMEHASHLILNSPDDETASRLLGMNDLKSSNSYESTVHRLSGSGRPASHPRVRIQQALGIKHQLLAYDSLFFLTQHPDEIARALFRSSTHMPGTSTARVLTGAALLPALWVLANTSGDYDRALFVRRHWLKYRMPASPDALTFFGNVGFKGIDKAGKAHTFQYRTYCKPRKCLDCMVGKAIV